MLYYGTLYYESFIMEHCILDDCGIEHCIRLACIMEHCVIEHATRETTPRATVCLSNVVWNVYILYLNSMACHLYNLLFNIHNLKCIFVMHLHTYIHTYIYIYIYIYIGYHMKGSECDNLFITYLCLYLGQKSDYIFTLFIL